MLFKRTFEDNGFTHSIENSYCSGSPLKNKLASFITKTLFFVVIPILALYFHVANPIATLYFEHDRLTGLWKKSFSGKNVFLIFLLT